MSILDDVEALKRMALFAKVEPAKLKLMAFAAERTQFRKGEEMFHQGDPADAAYIILEGRADVVVDTPGGPLKVAEVGSATPSSARSASCATCRAPRPSWRPRI